MFLTHCDLSLQDSDGEKSDDNLVVDVSNEVYTTGFFACYCGLGGGGGWDVSSVHIWYVNKGS